jgi:hypothetical protein
MIHQAKSNRPMLDEQTSSKRVQCFPDTQDLTPHLAGVVCAIQLTTGFIFKSSR